MATLSDLRTSLARDLRDTSNATWSTAELDDRINQGIDAVGSFYPREIVSTFATVSASVISYAATSYSSIYRIEQYDGTTFMGIVPHAAGEGPDSGWELHAGIVWLPPTFQMPAGYTLRAYGYGAYVQLTASTQTTDLDTSGIKAVLLFAQGEALWALVADRAKFRQWQADSQNTDVTALALAQMYNTSRGRWAAEVRRLRKMRKLG